MKTFISIAVFFAALTSVVFAQPYEPDPDLWIADGIVKSMAVSEEYIYIGGGFGVVGPNTGYGANLTAASDFPNLTFPKVNGFIHCVEPDGSGGWLIGGGFNELYKDGETFARKNLARINADGTVHPWNPDPSLTVEAIAVSGNNIYIGGQFTSIGSTSRIRLAKFDLTTGNLDPTWSPSANQIVYTIEVSSTGEVYVGGGFWTITVDGTPYTRSGLAKFNSSGFLDSWDPSANNAVYTIAISDDDDDVYVGGNFSTIGGVSRNCIAKLNNTAGSVDPDWNPGQGGKIHSIAVHESFVYVGGDFTTIGETPTTRNRLARINVEGEADGWNPNIDASVITIAIGGSSLYAGGLFKTVGSYSRYRIAKFNITSTVDLDLDWNPNASGEVKEIAADADNIYAGGSFVTIGGEPRNNIARLFRLGGAHGGTLDETWDPDTDYQIEGIVLNGSDIYICGGFTTVGGEPRRVLAQLDPTTGAALSWNPNPTGGTVYTMAISGNDMFVGGAFTSIGGYSDIDRLAKFDISTGDINSTWKPNPNNTVQTIAVRGDYIYVGGSFTSIGITPTTRQRLAKLNSDGEVVTGWKADANGTVNTIANSEDHIYVGGVFTTIESETRNRLAKLEVDETGSELDADWTPGSNSDVKSILSAGNYVYVGGNFSTIGGGSINKVAKLNNTTGNVDPDWDLDFNGSYVKAITRVGTDLYLGGDFFQASGEHHPNLVLYRDAVSNTIPIFYGETPACGEILPVIAGTPITFTVQAGDPDPGDFVVLDVSGLPFLSSMNPPLPITGNPVSSEFSWTPTPANIGFHEIVFTIVDDYAAAVECTLTVEVRPPAIIGDYVIPIALRDVGGTDSEIELQFGQRPTATNGIDTTFGEQILPPVPPVGTFDARFILPTVPEVSSLIDIRDSTETEVTWTLAFQPGPSGYPMTFIWDTLGFPSGTFLLTDVINGNIINVDMRNQSSYTITDPSITSLYIKYERPTTFQLSVNISNGWNIVSIPGLNSPDQNVNTWWAYRDQSANVFKYAGGYLPVTDAVPGIGYWMKHTGARTYNSGDEWPIEGIQIVPHDPINASAGWNLFGGYEISATASLITTNPPGLQTGPIYKYSGGYLTATSIDPGYGYWIKLSGAGQIIIPEALAKGTESVEWFPEDWGRIIITDAAGVSYTLYSVKGQVDLNHYELPPAPPSGMYDLRFSSGRIAEDINSAIQTIEMSGVVYPVTVSVEEIDIKLMDESGKVINTKLKPGENTVIDNPNITKFMVSGDNAPIEFSLQQNYPNPFNPVTRIKYSIAQNNFVNITVYDVLGREVKKLVNEDKPAGNYEVSFDASTIASGVYIYKINAGDFVDSKKMILMK
ncbi:MAG: T9SS type A sorting domain-containing protein [bacterium]|nr:T9SS type A sorting domain-containing protein [bacterium]